MLAKREKVIKQQTFSRNEEIALMLLMKRAMAKAGDY